MKRYFEEYELNTVQLSMGRTITETDIVLHAGQTGDFYPHHMDAEWSKTQVFGSKPFGSEIVIEWAIFRCDPGICTFAHNPKMLMGID